MTTITTSSIRPILDRVSEILIRKNHDYGDAWRRYGLAGILVRTGDKLMRIEHLDGKAALVVDEQVEDTLIDLIGYAILGLFAIDEQRRTNG